MALDYGTVIITAGKYKSKLGYYDDDCDDLAVVYLEERGGPFADEPIFVKPSILQNISSISHKKWKNKNRGLSELMGIK